VACLLAAGLATAGTTARAADASRDNLADARQAYDEGTRYYSLGEYEAAVKAFRRAYELAPAPALLFDIAQAHRLAGDCERALEAYRHFIRLDPASDHRADADANMAVLQAKCGEPSHTAAARVAEPPRVAQASAPPIVTPLLFSPPSSRRFVAIRALLIGGAAVGVAAAVTYFWNDARHSTWAQEDRALAMARPSNVDAESWVERQNANDRRLRSIQTADTVFGTLVGVSAAALTAAAVVAYWPTHRAPAVALRSEGLLLTWNARWP
jgi:tetratricopeptide (TPR) repeat protein